MALILDESQLTRLTASKRRRRRGRAVKVSPKEERAMRRGISVLWRQVLNPTADRIKQMVRDGASATDIAYVIEETVRSAQETYGLSASDIVNRWQMGVDDASRQALRRGLSKSLAVDVSAIYDVPEIAETLAIGSQEAAGLIKSIPGEYLEGIAQAVRDNQRGIPLPQGRSLLQEIQKIGSVSKRRAELIARDQTTKLTSAINQTRQQSIGIQLYIWRNMRDQRVVGNPSGLYPKGNNRHHNHWVMGGVYCKWDDQTVYSKDQGLTWLKRTQKMPKLAPGMEILCRCFAEPVIDVNRIVEFSQRR